MQICVSSVCWYADIADTFARLSANIGNIFPDVVLSRSSQNTTTSPTNKCRGCLSFRRKYEIAVLSGLRGYEWAILYFEPLDLRDGV